MEVGQKCIAVNMGGAKALVPYHQPAAGDNAVAIPMGGGYALHKYCPPCNSDDKSWAFDSGFNLPVLASKCGCGCPSLTGNIAYIYIGAPMPDEMPEGETHVALDVNSVQSWLEANNSFDSYQIKILGEHTLSSTKGLPLLDGKRFNVLGVDKSKENNRLILELPTSEPEIFTLFNLSSCINKISFNSQSTAIPEGISVRVYGDFCSCAFESTISDQSLDKHVAVVFDLSRSEVCSCSFNFDADILGNKGATGVPEESSGESGGGCEVSVFAPYKIYDCRFDVTCKIIAGDGGNHGGTKDGASGGSSTAIFRFRNNLWRSGFYSEIHNSTFRVNASCKSSDGGTGSDGYFSEAGFGGDSSSAIDILFANKMTNSTFTTATSSESGNSGYATNSGDSKSSVSVVFLSYNNSDIDNCTADHVGHSASGNSASSTGYVGSTSSSSSFSITSYNHSAITGFNVTTLTSSVSGDGGSTSSTASNSINFQLMHNCILTDRGRTAVAGTPGTGAEGVGGRVESTPFYPESIPDYTIKNLTNNGFIPYAVGNMPEFVHIDTVNGDDANKRSMSMT